MALRSGWVSIRNRGHALSPAFPGGHLLSITVPGFHNTSECFHDSQPVVTDVSLCVPTRRRMLGRTQHAHVRIATGGGVVRVRPVVCHPLFKLFLTAPFRIISLLITQLFLQATSRKHGAIYLFYLIWCLPKYDVNGPLISC